jgi:hypothetical protein
VEQKIAMEAVWEDQTLWPERPRIAEYCGFEEAQGRYHICDKKNPDGRCLDYRRVTSAELERNCATCVYRDAPTQEADDRRLLIVRAKLEIESRTYYNGMLSGITDETRDKARASVQLAAQKAFSDASVGVDDAQYFAVCARTAFKEGGRRVFSLCAWLNGDDRCPFWAPNVPAGQHRQVDKWVPEFELGGLYFSQEYEVESPVVTVRAAQFVNLKPESLRYVLEDLRVGDMYSLAGIVGGSVLLRENAGSRDYYVRRPANSKEIHRELFPMRRQ